MDIKHALLELTQLFITTRSQRKVFEDKICTNVCFSNHVLFLHNDVHFRRKLPNARGALCRSVQHNRHERSNMVKGGTRSGDYIVANDTRCSLSKGLCEKWVLSAS